MPTPKKILLLVGDYVEDYEVMVPFQIMTMFGHQVAAVCPGKRAGEKVITAIHDFEGEQTYSEKRGHYFQLNANFSEVQAADFDGLMIPGGRAPEYLRLNPDVIALVKAFNQAKKPIAAICHGPQVLTAAGVLEGRELTAYPAVKPEIEVCGGKWIDAGAGYDHVHVEGNFVTAPAWPVNALWTKAFLELLGGYPK